jgi:excisionase family DNA binding protein
MDKVRRADEREVQILPLLFRYCRLGPIFPIRTDGPAYEGASYPSIDAGAGNAISLTAPSQLEDGDSDVIFTPEAARLTKTNESRTRCLARNGVIPAFKVGKKDWRYSRKALEEWVRNQAIGSISVHTPLPKPSTLKTSAKPKATKKRKGLPTDLSPEALKKAIQGIRPSGE